MKKTQQQVKPITPKFDAKKYANSNVSQSQVIKIKQFYDLFDVQETGSINPKQLKAAMQTLGFESTHHTVYQLICDYDADGKGSIGFQDFLHLMTHRINQNDSQDTILKVFALYDQDKTGYVSIKNLRNIAKDIGQEISQQQLQEMFQKADQDKDGYVSAQQFYSVIARIH